MSSRLVGLALVLLVALTALVRLWGIDRLLPHRFEPDAFVVYQLEHWRDDPGSPTLQDFEQRYPTLLARLGLLLPRASVPHGLSAEQATAAHLARASRSFVEVRVIVALLSTLLVPLTYLLARRVFDGGRALLAAGFVATSLLHLQFSGQARPHGAATTLQFVALLLALRALDRRTWGSLALAAGSAGLALACLQTGIMVAPALAICAWRSAPSPRARWLRTAAALALMLAVALPFYPFLPTIDEGGLALSSHGGHPFRLEELSPVGFLRCAQDLWSYDPVLTFAAVLGGALALAGRVGLVQRATPRSGLRILLVAHALVYVLVLGFNANAFERLMLPILPYLALAAADATATAIAIVTRTLSGAWRIVVGSVVTLAVLALPALTAVQFARLGRVLDTYEQSAAWLEQHAGPDDIVLHSAAITLPVLHRRAELEVLLRDQALCGIPWLAYQRALPESELAHGVRVTRYPEARPLGPDGAPIGANDRDAARLVVAELHPRWIVVEDSRISRAIPWYGELREAARARGRLVFEARPSDDPAERGPHPYQGVSNSAWRLRALNAFGSRVEIYELEP